MNDRTCIVSRQSAEPDRLVRFVASPAGVVTPDLKRKLPGRGCWVTADRAHVDKAAAKKLFGRALKAEVTAPADLGQMVDGLLAQSALGALGLGRKAAKVVTGSAKVENAVRSGEAIVVLHAREAADDGVRKIGNARFATAHMGGPKIAAYKLFSEAEMGLALGGLNVIHAAVLASEAGRAALKRIEALDRYRGGSPEDQAMNAAVASIEGAAEDME